jgi:hypothetical protein
MLNHIQGGFKMFIFDYTKIGLVGAFCNNGFVILPLYAHEAIERANHQQHAA